MKTFEIEKKKTSAYEIYLKSVPDGSCSCFLCCQKKNVKIEDMISRSIPDLLDISPKPIISSSQRILKVHVHNYFLEFVKNKMMQYLGTY